MITNKSYKKTILKKIEELKFEQDSYRRVIEEKVHFAKSLGCDVHTYEDMTFVYLSDMTVPDWIQSSIRRCEGVIQGLQFAIETLEKEL